MAKVIVEERKSMGTHNKVYDIKEEGVSNFVSDKSLVNPIIEDFEKRGTNFPIVFGVPRSGSTLIRNILNTIFDGRVNVQRHNYFDFEENDMIIASYRDFRDCTISKWRMNTGGFDTEKNLVKVGWSKNKVYSKNENDSFRIKGNTVSGCANALKRRVDALNRFDKLYKNQDRGSSTPTEMKTNRNIYFARYEQFHDNFGLLFNHLEQFLQIVIKKDLKDFIQNTWNRTRIKRVYSDSIEAFSGYDKDTEIHGHHIYKGKVGTWKEILQKDHHSSMNAAWKEELKHWGYEL